MKLRASPPRLLPLTIVVMALLLSAKVVTFASEATKAIGGQTSSTGPVVAPGSTSATKTGLPPDQAVSHPITKPGAPLADVTPSERALLEDLRQRREALDQREQALEERKTVADAAEASLEARITQLSTLQSSLQQLDGARKQRQSANWTGLVKVYEDMKPRDAATIFDVLDIHVLLEVLDRMNERKAAAVLAAMQPERARMATQMLAQMRTSADSQEAVQISNTSK